MAGAYYHPEVKGIAALSGYRDTFENGMSGTDLSDVEADRFYGADSEMMKEIVAFYDKCIGE